MNLGDKLRHLSALLTEVANLLKLTADSKSDLVTVSYAIHGVLDVTSQADPPIAFKLPLFFATGLVQRALSEVRVGRPLSPHSDLL